jgi:hypothetical protein
MQDVLIGKGNHQIKFTGVLHHGKCLLCIFITKSGEASAKQVKSFTPFLQAGLKAVAAQARMLPAFHQSMRELFEGSVAPPTEVIWPWHGKYASTQQQDPTWSCFINELLFTACPPDEYAEDHSDKGYELAYKERTEIDMEEGRQRSDGMCTLAFKNLWTTVQEQLYEDGRDLDISGMDRGEALRLLLERGHLVQFTRLQLEASGVTRSSDVRKKFLAALAEVRDQLKELAGFHSSDDSDSESGADDGDEGGRGGEQPNATFIVF